MQPGVPYRYIVEVGVSTHKYRDFSNVSANYQIQNHEGHTIQSGPIIEDQEVNRNVYRKQMPIVLICPLDADTVFYKFNDAGNFEPVQLARGQSLYIKIEATAKNMAVQRRSFTIGVRPHVDGRLMYWSDDGKFLFTAV